MSLLFYIAAACALLATGLAITRKNVVHAVLLLVVTLLSLAVVFFVLGAPFAGALQIIVYAGAILVLFLFAAMLLDLGREGVLRERGLLQPGAWVLPSLLCGILGLTLLYALLAAPGNPVATKAVSAREVARWLFNPSFAIGVELASLLLLGALVATLHLTRKGD